MSSTQDVPQTTSGQSSSFSFAQGFILGQISIVILIGAFIKFFVFGEASSSQSSSDPSLSTLTPSHKRSVSFTHQPSSPRKRVLKNKASSSHILRQPQPLTTTAILSKTYYNVQSHQPESLDWFNVLLAQTIAQLRTDALADNAVLTSLRALLNGPRKPSFLDKISVTEIALGEDFPIFSNCRIHPVEDEEGRSGGRLQARMDVDLSDFITLGIETTMVLNYPRPRVAVLPVALSVSVVRFSGTLSISFEPASVPLSQDNVAVRASTSAVQDEPTASTRIPTTLAFSFLPNYTLSLSTRSLLGARSRLQDIPKIAQIIENQLRTWFEERCVAPKTQQIVVPSLWPRMKNVVDEEDKSATSKPETDVAQGFRHHDIREEALRELDSEHKRQAESGREWEGLRWRGSPSEPTNLGAGTQHGHDRPNREDNTQAWLRTSNLELPGPMPGTLVS